MILKVNMFPIGSKLAVFKGFHRPVFWLYDTEKQEWPKHTYNCVENV